MMFLWNADWADASRRGFLRIFFIFVWDLDVSLERGLSGCKQTRIFTDFFYFCVGFFILRRFLGTRIRRMQADADFYGFFYFCVGFFILRYFLGTRIRRMQADADFYGFFYFSVKF
jgi:hypothetical protein